MGFFGKLFKGPEIDQAKSDENKRKMRRLFDSVVPDGGTYQLMAAYTEDVKRFNYGLVHGSKTTYTSLIVGWKEGPEPTVAVVPTVPDLSGCGDAEICPRSTVKKAYQNKYPTDAFIIYPDGKHYLSITTFEWLEDEKLFIYADQGPEQQGLPRPRQGAQDAGQPPAAAGGPLLCPLLRRQTQGGAHQGLHFLRRQGGPAGALPPEQLGDAHTV